MRSPAPTTLAPPALSSMWGVAVEDVFVEGAPKAAFPRENGYLSAHRS